MELTLLRTGIPEMLPMERVGDENRHVSTVIRSLCLQLGHFDDDGEITAETISRWEMGSAFEGAVCKALAERYERESKGRVYVPGTLELDGLLGSPDLLSSADETVHEIKLTWLSSRHDPASSDKFWKYWVQGKAYCYMMGWRKLHLHVAHIMGNYKDERGPTYNVWAAEFTQSELLENWAMLRMHSDELMRKAKAGNRKSRG